MSDYGQEDIVVHKIPNNLKFEFNKHDDSIQDGP
jgi:hypothetical protein